MTPAPCALPHLPDVPDPFTLLARAHDLLTHLPELAVTHLPVLVLCASVLATAAGWIAWSRRSARRRWYDQARTVTVLAPADLDADSARSGARRAWWELLGLARPRWRRLIAGQPHLAVELWVLPGKEPMLRIWIPSTIPPGRVENALRASWPGCLLLEDDSTSHGEPAPSPAPRETSTQDTTIAPSGRHAYSDGQGSGGIDPMASFAAAGTITAGKVRPQRAEYVPLRIPQPRDDADPLRTLEALAERLDDGEMAVVQIVARPALGRRLLRFRTRVHQVHQGRPARSGLVISLVTGCVRAVLDLLSPGPDGHTSQATTRRIADPLVSDELRAIRDKAEAPLWEVAVCYAAATRATGPAARQRVRGVADAVAGVFAVLAGRNFLRRRRLRRPHQVLPGRRLSHASLWSVGELATLAHLPVRTTHLAGHVARGIPAPDTVTRTDP